MVQLKGTHKCAVKILVFVLVVNEYFYNHSDHLAVDLLKRFESLLIYNISQSFTVLILMAACVSLCYT